MAACVVAVLAFTASALTAAPPAQRSIVLLLGDDFTRPWVQLTTQGFREAVLRNPSPPRLYFESFDIAQFDDPAYPARFRDWLSHKYAGRAIDLVVPIADEAIRFVADGNGEPWPGAQVLYVEVGYTTVDTARLPGWSGVIFDDHVPHALGLIRQLLPSTRRVVLLIGASQMERDRFATFGGKVRAAGLEPVELPTISLDDAAGRVAHLPDDAVVFPLVPYIDTSGRALAPSAPCERLSAAANRPTFMMATHDLGCGIVGGRLRDMTALGRIVGQHALSRLAGGPATNARVPIDQYTTLAFDDRQLRRWGIADSQLPAGAAVNYREPNLWRDYRPAVLAVLTVVLVQSCLIVGLVIEHRRRRRAEVNSRRHLATMAHLDRRAALGQLTASLAHELNQPLGAILRNAEATRMLLDQPAPDLEEVRQIVDDIRADDRRASEVVRGLRALLHKHELAADAIDINDVVADTVTIARPDAAARGVRVDVDVPARPTIVTGDKVHLQQALLNVLLNGIEAVAAMPPDARRVEVRAIPSNGAVTVSVADSGPGISPDVARQMFEPFYSTKGQGAGMGLGLSIVQSIIEAHGGSVGAETGPSGAVVSFSLPVGHKAVGI